VLISLLLGGRNKSHSSEQVPGLNAGGGLMAESVSSSKRQPMPNLIEGEKRGIT